MRFRHMQVEGKDVKPGDLLWTDRGRSRRLVGTVGPNDDMRLPGSTVVRGDGWFRVVLPGEWALVSRPTPD